MHTPRLHRETERRLAWIIGSVLGAVLVSGIAAAAERPVPAPAVPAAAGVATATGISAGDIVPPTPVDITFAKPQRHSSPVAVAQVRTAPPTVEAVPADPTCSGDGWRERRGAAALAGLLHPVPAGVSLAFLPGGGALKGMTYYDRHHVDVYVGSCRAESDALLRHVVAHEMGHAWDSLHMTDALRADYLVARGIPAGTPWFGCNECQDFATPAGDFAETYAQWQRGSADSRTRMAAPATPAQLAELGARFFS